MKPTLCFLSALAMATVAAAETHNPATDASLINIETPTLLARSKSAALLDLRYVGGYDKTMHTSVWYGYGLCDHLELDLAGTFEKWNSAIAGSGSDIRFGGSDEEAMVRYQIPFVIPVTVEGGLAYTQTPAQAHRLVSSLTASAGYAPDPKVRFYLNPKLVFLDHNSLFGIGIGTAIDLAPKISLIADWTPIVAGENTLTTMTAGRTKGQLYSAGLRFGSIFPQSSLDIGVTSASGITTGSSLTPTLGDAPALFARVSYRF